jgi:hypothetical protein
MTVGHDLRAINAAIRLGDVVALPSGVVAARSASAKGDSRVVAEIGRVSQIYKNIYITHSLFEIWREQFGVRTGAEASDWQLIANTRFRIGLMGASMSLNNWRFVTGNPMALLDERVLCRRSGLDPTITILSVPSTVPPFEDWWRP